MRKMPVAAIVLVVVSGIYFQVKGSSNFAARSTPNVPGIISPQKPAQRVTEATTDRSMDSPVLVSQASPPGPPSKPHKVTLSWNPSLPISGTEQDSISGYAVYRRSASADRFVRINSDVLSDTTYVDDDVLAGQTYEYETRAVNNLGIESAPSNDVRVTIPNP